MPEDRINPQPDNEENVERNENNDEKADNERFMSDTQRIIHRHLEDKEDIITDEDIANVRIGMAPPPDAPTEARFEGEEAKDQVEEELLGDTSEEEDEVNSKNDKLSPWDTLQSED